MASLAQLEANRRNSQKSTGPRTAAGKITSSSNSFKTGLYAESALIRGEDPAALDDLAREYLATCRPIGPREQAAVDALIHADWLLRRMRRIETMMWNYRLDERREKDDDFEAGLDPLVVWLRNDADFERIQRRLSALDRSYHRALADLHRLQTHRQPADPDPDTAPPEIGFVPSPPLQPAAVAPPRSPIGFVPPTFLQVFTPLARPKDSMAASIPLTCGYVEDSHKKVKNVRISANPFGLYCDLRGQS